MTIAIRCEIVADYPAVAALLSLGYVEGASAEDVRTWRRDADDARVCQHLVAVGADDMPVGCAHMRRDPWEAPGVFWVHVAVDAAHRRQGLGARLYGRVLEAAREHGATNLRGEVREALPEGMSFAARHGFTVQRHIFE